VIALHLCFLIRLFSRNLQFVISLIVNYLTAYITQFHLISFIKQTEHMYIFQLGREKEKGIKQNMKQKTI